MYTGAGGKQCVYRCRRQAMCIQVQEASNVYTGAVGKVWVFRAAGGK